MGNSESSPTKEDDEILDSPRRDIHQRRTRHTQGLGRLQKKKQPGPNMMAMINLLSKSPGKSDVLLKSPGRKKKLVATSYFNEEGSRDIVAILPHNSSADNISKVGPFAVASFDGENKSCSPSPMKIQTNNTGADLNGGGELPSSEVRLARDPFKTGFKHYYNMIRPTLYRQETNRNSSLSSKKKSKHGRDLSASDINFLERKRQETLAFKKMRKTNSVFTRNGTVPSVGLNLTQSISPKKPSPEMDRRYQRGRKMNQTDFLEFIRKLRNSRDTSKSTLSPIKSTPSAVDSFKLDRSLPLLGRTFFTRKDSPQKLRVYTNNSTGYLHLRRFNLNQRSQASASRNNLSKIGELRPFSKESELRYPVLDSTQEVPPLKLQNQNTHQNISITDQLQALSNVAADTGRQTFREETEPCRNEFGDQMDIHVTPREQDHTQNKFTIESLHDQEGKIGSITTHLSIKRNHIVSEDDGGLRSSLVPSLAYFRGRMKNIRNKKEIARKQFLKGGLCDQQQQLLENHFINLSRIHGDQDSEGSLGNFSSDHDNPLLDMRQTAKRQKTLKHSHVKSIGDDGLIATEESPRPQTSRKKTARKSMNSYDDQLNSTMKVDNLQNWKSGGQGEPLNQDASNINIATSEVENFNVFQNSKVKSKVSEERSNLTKLDLHTVKSLTPKKCIRPEEEEPEYSVSPKSELGGELIFMKGTAYKYTPSLSDKNFFVSRYLVLTGFSFIYFKNEARFADYQGNEEKERWIRPALLNVPLFHIARAVPIHDITDLYTPMPDDNLIRRQLSLKTPKMPGSPHTKKLLCPSTSSQKHLPTKESIFEVVLTSEGLEATSNSCSQISPTTESKPSQPISALFPLEEESEEAEQVLNKEELSKMAKDEAIRDSRHGLLKKRRDSLSLDSKDPSVVESSIFIIKPSPRRKHNQSMTMGSKKTPSLKIELSPRNEGRKSSNPIRRSATKRDSPATSKRKISLPKSRRPPRLSSPELSRASVLHPPSSGHKWNDRLREWKELEKRLIFQCPGGRAERDKWVLAINGQRNNIIMN